MRRSQDHPARTEQVVAKNIAGGPGEIGLRCVHVWIIFSRHSSHFPLKKSFKFDTFDFGTRLEILNHRFFVNDGSSLHLIH